MIRRPGPRRKIDSPRPPSRFLSFIRCVGVGAFQQPAKPAETEREWWALLKNHDHTFVRSMKEWEAALADPQRNPLKGCDPKTIEYFTKNLRFEHGGLAHADYSTLDEKLTYRQFAELWRLFGLGMGLFSDHEGYACTGRATCSQAPNTICTSNC